MKSEQKNLYMKIHDIIELIKNKDNESVIIRIHSLMKNDEYSDHYVTNRNVTTKLRRIWVLIDAGDVEEAENELRMFQLNYLSRLQERDIQINYIPPNVSMYAHQQLKNWMFKNNTYHIKGE